MVLAHRVLLLPDDAIFCCAPNKHEACAELFHQYSLQKIQRAKRVDVVVDLKLVRKAASEMVDKSRSDKMHDPAHCLAVSDVAREAIVDLARRAAHQHYRSGGIPAQECREHA